MQLRVLLFCLAGVGMASAFLPVRTSVRAPSTLPAYVPDGLTPAQYEAQKAKEAARKAANKIEKRKGSIETLDEFNLSQQKKFPGQPGAGHRFVKLKGDALKGKKTGRFGAPSM